MFHSSELGWQVRFFFFVLNVLPLQEDSSWKVKKQRTGLGMRFFAILPEGPGLSDCVTLSQRVPKQAGVPCSRFATLSASPRPYPPSWLSPGSSPSGAASFGTKASRCPARRRSRATAASPAPRTVPPREFADPVRRLQRLQPPLLPALLPLGALDAKPATCKQSAEPSGAHGAPARTTLTSHSWSPRSSHRPVDAPTMAAERPSSGAWFWAAALLLLGLQRLSVRADGECRWSAGKAVGRGWRAGTPWRKRSSL